MSKEQVKNFQETGTLFSAKNINATIAKNAKEQKELAKEAFKQKARFEALNTAQYLKPNTEYVRGGKDNKEAIRVIKPYDVVKEAERIYQWLIKIVK
ncbi:MAG: hypothetical protein KAY50_12040 [Chitinophagaceae bacterium]|jgi:hypothetical protein|nr:hypothetical protein [Chitinophagaceae bacterium]